MLYQNFKCKAERGTRNMRLKYKITCMFAAIMLAVTTTRTTHADPVYYTFGGTITTINTTTNNSVAEDIYSIGESVSYTIMADLDLQGTRELHDGTITTFNDRDDTYITDNYFYAEFINGDIVPEVNGGMNNAPTDVKHMNHGKEHRYTQYRGPTNYNTRIDMGSRDESIIFYKGTQYGGPANKFSNWVIGTTDITFSALGFNELDYSYISGTLTLGSISTQAPLAASVPEPSLGLLLGISLVGLVGVGAVRKLRQKALVKVNS